MDRLLDRAEQPVGPRAAVHAHGHRRGSVFRQRREHPLDRLAHHGLAVLDHGERKHVGHVRHAPHGQGELLHGRAGADRLEQDEVGAALDEALDLLDDHRLDLRLVLGLRRHRADVARHVNRPPGGVGDLPGDSGAGEVDLAGHVGQAVPAQRHPVGRERVRRQHVGAGVGVVREDPADQPGVGQTQLVVTPVGEDVMPIDLGAHRAVEDQHALANRLGKTQGRGHDLDGWTLTEAVRPGTTV